MTDNNKPTVVDDFFSALFANDNNKLNTKETIIEESKEQEPYPQDPYQRLQTYQEQQLQEQALQQHQEMKQIKKPANVKKHEKELDEFDEYSLLSSKRKLDGTGHQAAAIKKRATAAPESTNILSKKSIDWSDVSPESRMLIRQLPNRVDKEDVMDYFSTYGEVLEVVFKNAFGFVQFDSPFACANAVKCENGKKFKGVVLELEVCRTKPYFAREDDKHRQKAGRGTGFGMSNRANGKNHRRNEDYHHRRLENRQPQTKHTDDSEYDPSHPEMKVPLVKIIAWNNVSKQFVSYIENEFRKKNVSVVTVILQYPNTRESLLKQMVREGVKAVVTINRDLESQKKVSLQVFSPDEAGTGVRFDEYDSIMGEQAAEIVLHSMPHYVPESTYQTSAAIPNNNYTASSVALPMSAPAASTQSLDSNTLAVLYNMLQAKPSPVSQYHQPSAVSTPSMQYHTQLQTQIQQQQQQPTVSQLLATLMNGLNQSNQTSHYTSPTMNGTYNVYSSSQASIPSAPQNISPPQQQQHQHNIAQLLSTAMNGNPLLGHIVANQASAANNSNVINDNNQLRNILTNYQLLTSQSSPNQGRATTASATPTSTTVVNNDPSATIPNSNSYNLTTMARQ
ncbi:hypothetical protein G6F38_008179 [Rhizopus arrhizus]|nr:hypothetical protein G6F38_008179 [Rhizopus arrhizus]